MSPFDLVPLADSSHLIAGRTAMGLSLTFHIVFSCIGVAFPAFILTAHALWLRTGNPVWEALARKWSKALGVTFAVGAVSGTVLSFDLGLLWPEFMRFSGSVIGIPFTVEGFSFLIEAIFLGLYIYGWNRFSPKMHLIAGLPLFVTGIVGAASVVSVNRWMNIPSGFDVVDGKPANIDIFEVIFGPSWGPHVLHMILAAYIAVAFGVAGIYAMGMLRGRRDDYHRSALTLALVVGAILTPLQFGVGDLLARDVAEYQPLKLATMEALEQTTKGAGENIVGIPIPFLDETILNVRIPKLLSVLGYDDPDATVRGIESFPEDDRPDLFLVRASWLAMLGFGTSLLLLSIWVFVARRVKGRLPTDRWTLRWIVAAGPAGFLAVEAGWYLTEFGRQPWVIYGILRTEDAVTPSPLLELLTVCILILYLSLGALTIWLLRRMATGMPDELREPRPPRKPDDDDDESGAAPGTPDPERQPEPAT